MVYAVSLSLDPKFEMNCLTLSGSVQPFFFLSTAVSKCISSHSIPRSTVAEILRRLFQRGATLIGERKKEK